MEKPIAVQANMAHSSDDEEENPEQLLDEWLGELDILTGGLDTVTGSGDTPSHLLRPLSNEIAAPRIDSYRFSMANLEDSQDVDLDAILVELCALETRYQEEIGRASSMYSTNNNQRPYQRSDRQTTNNSGGIHHGRAQTISCTDGVPSVLPPAPHRTDSPDNDSAFSDTVSLLSSESSASSGASAGNKNQGLQLNLQPLKDMASQLKTEKIRLALEKMKEASVKKLFIKAFSIDGSSKSLLVDEKMTCGYVARLLADKNHLGMEPKWAIVEYLPDLHMERIYEDHELLVDNLMLWTRESKNKIIFSERLDKISLFQTPEKFLISGSEKGLQTDYDEHSRTVIMDEFFSQTLTSEMVSEVSVGSIPTVPNLSGNPVPPLEGPLYLKSDSKKGWKRYHFVMRPSGIHYYPKEKIKSPKDLVCLANFDVNEIYLGLNWKKKYKAPTDFCFAIKHPKLQQPKSVKFIKFLCAEDHETLEKWIVAMRIAKHGRQLLENYRCLVDDLAQEDLDQLAHARSCSVASISQNSGNIIPQQTSNSPDNGIQAQPLYEESITGSSDTSSGRHSCVSSSSSSGCMSDGPSGSEGNAFDSEFPMGTIKRKPSMKPNIPLTSMTRQLKEMVDMAALSSSQNSINSGSDHSSNGSLNTSGYTNTGTLTRRHSRRKSNQSSNTDDSSNSGTLKRLTHKTSRASLESANSLRSSSSGCSTPTMAAPLRDFIYNSTPTNGGKPMSIDSENSHNIYSTSPANIYKSHTSDALPSTGILLGYITHQTIINNAHPQYFKENNSWYDKSPGSDNSLMENNVESGRAGSSQQNYPQQSDEIYMQNENNLMCTNIETDQSRPKDFMFYPQNSMARMEGAVFSPTSVDIQDMPLPPPPQISLLRNGTSGYDELKNQNSDPLYWSTLSLDSLPPPPPNLDDHATLEGYNLSGSQLSLISLPPPPLPITDEYTSPSDHPATMQSDRNGETKNPPSRTVSEIVNQLTSTLASQQICNKGAKEKIYVPPPAYVSPPPYGAHEPIKNTTKPFGNKEVCGKPPSNSQPIVYGSTNPCQNFSLNMFPRQSSVNSLSSTSSNNSQNSQSNSLSGTRVNDDKNSIYTCSVLPNIHSKENQTNLPNVINSGMYASCLAELQSKTQDPAPPTLKKLYQSNSQHSDGTLNSYVKSVSFADTTNSHLENESPILLRKQSLTDTKSGPCSPNKKHKKLTFSLSVDSESSESPPNLPNKPPPPKRNETTKLSSPKKLSDSTSNPPKDFLKDLQRVMRKKWQVAQKCKLEPTTTPHEVLGFREFPVLTEDYKEANVSNWVQEHYGRSGTILPAPDNLYENINKSDKTPKSVGNNSDDLQNVADVQKGAEGRAPIIKKRPPPPPPKRSESTQLTTLPNQKLR